MLQQTLPFVVLKNLTRHPARILVQYYLYHFLFVHHIAFHGHQWYSYTTREELATCTWSVLHCVLENVGLIGPSFAQNPFSAVVFFFFYFCAAISIFFLLFVLCGYIFVHKMVWPSTRHPLNAPPPSRYLKFNHKTQTYEKKKR